jgi:hypothetical protein
MGIFGFFKKKKKEEAPEIKKSVEKIRYNFSELELEQFINEYISVFLG